MKHWEDINIYFDGDEYYDDLVRSIDAAKICINMECYIFENDATGKYIIDSLVRAAKRGINIKLIVDGFGSMLFDRNFGKILQSVGIKYKLYHKIPITSVFTSLKSFKSIYNINKRNHRKVFIIDHNMVYIGSRNISDVHRSKQNGGEGWNDLTVSAKEGAIELFEMAFTKAWSCFTWKRIYEDIYVRTKKNEFINLARLNFTFRIRRRNFKLLKTQINDAKSCIYITSAYFIPEPSFISTLLKARERNIDIQIMLPHTSDVFFIPYITSLFYDSLTAKGIRVFEYIPSMLHSKLIIIDDIAAVGSSNLNSRSLLHDLEADIIISDKDKVTLIKEKFFSDTTQSEEIHHKKGKNRLKYYIIGKIFSVFKYWF